MPLSVYVHFPWCLQKCPYCDFASASIARDAVPSADYADAVLRELEQRVTTLGGETLGSVFFGGGTPSLWEPAQLGRVLAGVRAAFAAEAPGLEVTVECNPSSLDQAKAAALRAVGVNRLSVGVQSLDAGRLRFLGRLHDGASALSALRAARREVPRVSADLMFGMPGQSAADFLDELQRVLPLELEHLSIYALTIEPETQFGALHRKGRLQLAKEGDFADTYLRTEALLAELGYAHYEVSNYALPDKHSRHNAHYWHGGAYLGLGAGAVGCLHAAPGRARRYRNDPNPERYARANAEAREVFSESLDGDDLTREALMLGLRTTAGVDLAACEARSGRPVSRGRERAIERARTAGNLTDDRLRLRVPQARWLHLDGIVADLF